MELTTRGRYAVMAMADIARHGAVGALPLSQIAERQRLPLPYLEQLFLGLRRAGLVDSARGRLGGYRLARVASEISVLDVMRAVEEETHFTRCANNDTGCVAGARCLTHGLWQGLSDAASNYLQATSLADIVDNHRHGAEPTKAAKSGRIYLDYNATAPLRPVARAAMIAALDAVGNASSVHSEGRQAREVVESARESVAELINAKASEIVFTSGATEANAAAMAQDWDTILVSAIEHDSILAPAKVSGARIIEIPVGASGQVRTEEVVRQILGGGDLGRTLLAVQFANNETGVVQPIGELADFAREHSIFLHVDAVQAAGRLAIDFQTLAGITTMSLSSHKIGGPKGAGALVVRDRIDLEPLVRGGGQERRRRGGTENIAAIAGFGAAAREARRDYARFQALAVLRDRLEAGVRCETPGAIIVGQEATRLANTSCIALPGRNAETLVIKLDLAGIAVSAGAACSSGKVGASHVLTSMGLAPEIARSAIRVSIGPDITQEHVAAFLAAWKDIAGEASRAA